MEPDPNSPRDTNQADVAPDDDGTAECEGTFDPTSGHCKRPHHTHCPWCRAQYGCRHFLAGWNDDFGLHEVEPPRLYDDSVGELLAGDWRTIVAPELHGLFEIYAADGSQVHLLDEALTVAGVDADRQYAEMLDRMPTSFCYSWYGADAEAARTALQAVWQRVEATFTVLCDRPRPSV